MNTVSPETKPLSAKRLNTVLKDIGHGIPLTPAETAGFLALGTEGSRTLSGINKAAPVLLGIGYVASFAARNSGILPDITGIDPTIHQLLQALHNLTVNRADSQTLGAHIPYLLMNYPAAS